MSRSVGQGSATEEVVVYFKSDIGSWHYVRVSLEEFATLLCKTHRVQSSFVEENLVILPALLVSRSCHFLHPLWHCIAEDSTLSS